MAAPAAAETDTAAAAAVQRRLYTASALCASFLLVEVLGGYLAGSLAVLSDAAHLLADLAALLVAIAASHLAALPPSAQHTYGLKRTESLAALLSVLSLAIVSVVLAAEALRRLYYILVFVENVDTDGEPASVVLVVNGTIMSGTAAIGVAVNVVLALILGEHHVHLPGAASAHDHSHDDHAHGHEHHHHHGDGGGHDGDADAATAVQETTPLLVRSFGGGEQHHSDEVDPQLAEGELLHDHQHHHQHHQHDDEEKATTEQQQQQRLKKTNRNVNLHAAYIHVLGDLAQSVAVLVAGLVIWVRPDWHLVDPLVTLLFCAIVFASTLGVMRGSVAVLLEEVPPNIRWNEVYRAISQVPTVEGVHDLHIWSISDGVPVLSVHCFLADSTDTDGKKDANQLPQQALRDVYAVCTKYGIHHATIQIQCRTSEEEEGCVTCPTDPHPCDHPGVTGW